MEHSDESSVPFLTDLESEYTATEKSHKSTLDNPRTTKCSKTQTCFWISCIVVVTLLTNTTTYLTTHQPPRNLDQVCAKHTSQTWSPILDKIDIEYETVRFNGSLFTNTIYREDASPEVDEAWYNLGTKYKAIIIPPEDAPKAGISLDHFRVDEKDGGPGYPAIVEVMHQLHCLNLLRQGLYYNSEYYHNLGEGPFKNEEYILKAHINHCLDTVRQSLMCSADTGAHPFLWAKSGDRVHLYPDFNRDHKCKNFDDIRQFAEKHQAPWREDGQLDVQPKEGEVVLPAIP
ncbi:putative tat pathway signal sequence protein [Botrytis fragariae]|uniref:Putative tat pathway signal sequence protein n=1 Tax=Botrytis fragariae TaxID=1964551 RepID=A0A8H6ANP9_9HELO|nr:putative tat pathway signal sequence protein [Botrytis fragariae]KAF5870822.1 putative tat pathway signal sequence protein [Botrytis fragariae]